MFFASPRLARFAASDDSVASLPALFGSLVGLEALDQLGEAAGELGELGGGAGGLLGGRVVCRVTSSISAIDDTTCSVAVRCCWVARLMTRAASRRLLHAGEDALHRLGGHRAELLALLGGGLRGLGGTRGGGGGLANLR